LTDKEEIKIIKYDRAYIDSSSQTDMLARHSDSPPHTSVYYGKILRPKIDRHPVRPPLLFCFSFSRSISPRDRGRKSSHSGFLALQTRDFLVFWSPAFPLMPFFLLPRPDLNSFSLLCVPEPCGFNEPFPRSVSLCLRRTAGLFPFLTVSAPY